MAGERMVLAASACDLMKSRTLQHAPDDPAVPDEILGGLDGQHVVVEKKEPDLRVAQVRPWS
jgi:hypothetical protein